MRLSTFVGFAIMAVLALAGFMFYYMGKSNGDKDVNVEIRDQSDPATSTIIIVPEGSAVRDPGSGTVVIPGGSSGDTSGPADEQGEPFFDIEESPAAQ